MPSTRKTKHVHVISSSSGRGTTVIGVPAVIETKEEIELVNTSKPPERGVPGRKCRLWPQSEKVIRDSGGVAETLFPF